MALKTAEAYLPAILTKLKVDPKSPHTVMYTAIIEAVLTILADAEVSPAGTPVPLTSPSGSAGGPVSGTGKLV